MLGVVSKSDKKNHRERGKKMLKTAVKKTAITKVLSCFLVFVILMSAVPVSVLAVNGSNNATNASSNGTLLETSAGNHNSNIREVMDNAYVEDTTTSHNETFNNNTITTGKISTKANIHGCTEGTDDGFPINLGGSIAAMDVLDIGLLAL